MLNQTVSLGQAHLGDGLGAQSASRAEMARFKKSVIVLYGPQLSIYTELMTHFLKRAISPLLAN